MNHLFALHFLYIFSRLIYWTFSYDVDNTWHWKIGSYIAIHNEVMAWDSWSCTLQNLPLGEIQTLLKEDVHIKCRHLRGERNVKISTFFLQTFPQTTSNWPKELLVVHIENVNDWMFNSICFAPYFMYWCYRIWRQGIHWSFARWPVAINHASNWSVDKHFHGRKSLLWARPLTPFF